MLSQDLLTKFQLPLLRLKKLSIQAQRESSGF